MDKALISIDKDKTQCATLTDLANKHSGEFKLYLVTEEIKTMILFLNVLYVKKELNFWKARK